MLFFWHFCHFKIYRLLFSLLVDLTNPWLEFVNNNEATIGSSLSITMEGTRPIIIETESLTTYTKFWLPKRSARGVNSSKLDLIIAVLGKYTPVKLDAHDVYSNIARGMKIDEPWIDCSLAASIISSKNNVIIPQWTIFIGEISLTWKIKNVMYIEKRIKEAEKMWFKIIVVPKLSKKITSTKIQIREISNVSELVNNI